MALPCRASRRGLRHPVSSRTASPHAVRALRPATYEVSVMSTTTTTKRPAGSTKHASASPTRERLSTKQLRPLGDRVVVEPTPQDEMTKSGILIPDTVKEKPQED